MSLSETGGPIGSKKDNFLNWETIHWSNYWDPSNSGGNDDSGEIRAGSELWTNVDIDMPDQYVLAIHAIRVHLSDPVEDQGSDTREIDLFVYNEEILNDIGGFGSRVSEDDYFYGYSSQYRQDPTNGVGVSEQGSAPYVEFPLPILNARGEISVLQVGTTGAAGSGEAAVELYYDIIPVETTERYLELLLKR